MFIQNSCYMMFLTLYEYIWGNTLDFILIVYNFLYTCFLFKNKWENMGGGDVQMCPM